MRLASLNEVKDALRIPAAETSEDAALESIIEELSGECQDFLGRTLEETEYTDEAYPGGVGTLVLRNYPISSTETITVKEFNGTQERTLAADAYHVKHDFGMITLRSGFFASGPDAVRVTYTAGYAENGAADPDDVRLLAPTPLVRSVRELSRDTYRARRAALTPEDLAKARKSAERTWRRFARIAV